MEKTKLHNKICRQETSWKGVTWKSMKKMGGRHYLRETCSEDENWANYAQSYDHLIPLGTSRVFLIILKVSSVIRLFNFYRHKKAVCNKDPRLPLNKRNKKTEHWTIDPCSFMPSQSPTCVC